MFRLTWYDKVGFAVFITLAIILAWEGAQALWGLLDISITFG